MAAKGPYAKEPKEDILKNLEEGFFNFEYDSEDEVEKFSGSDSEESEKDNDSLKTWVAASAPVLLPSETLKREVNKPNVEPNQPPLVSPLHDDEIEYGSSPRGKYGIYKK